jgi:PHP family Zn ribbon phosphoesterase
MIQVPMSLSKETKGTVVYKADTPAHGVAPVETVYIHKNALEKPYPTNIILTVDLGI